MIMKPNDTIIAKNTFFLSEDDNILQTTPNLVFLVKNRKYTVVDVFNTGNETRIFYVESEWSNYHRFNINNFHKFFYTTKELRQLKLQQLR